MKFNRVAILMAMKDEATPILRRLNLEQTRGRFPENMPFEVFQGVRQGLEITLITSGKDSRFDVDNVATQPATLMAYLAIQNRSPDIIINAGTAGGFYSKGCQIGDVYLSSDLICFHDRRIPLPNFDKYGIGSYRPYDTSHIARKLNLKTGRVSTGNSLHHTDQDLEIIRRNEGVIKDMEAAAIAWVCEITNTPMFAVKAITDLLDKGDDTERQFENNMTLAVTNLTDTIQNVISLIA